MLPAVLSSPERVFGRFLILFLRARRALAFPATSVLENGALTTARSGERIALLLESSRRVASFRFGALLRSCRLFDAPLRLGAPRFGASQVQRATRARFESTLLGPYPIGKFMFFGIMKRTRFRCPAFDGEAPRRRVTDPTGALLGLPSLLLLKRLERITALHALRN